MTNELIILRDLTDEEIIKLTDTEIDDMISSYKENGIPERATVKGFRIVPGVSDLISSIITSHLAEALSW